MSTTYEVVKSNQCELQKNENNDCSVVAMSILTGYKYSTVHALFKKYGRKDRKGTQNEVTDKVIKELESKGFVFEEIRPRQDYIRHGERQEFGKYSLRTIIKFYPKGKYLIHVHKHALAMVDGKIEDWSKGTMKRVIKMWKVTKPKAKK